MQSNEVKEIFAGNERELERFVQHSVDKKAELLAYSTRLKEHAKKPGAGATSSTGKSKKQNQTWAWAWILIECF